MRRVGSLSTIAFCTLAVLIFFFSNQSVKAGWTGVMNGTGFGWASVNVTSSTLNSNSVKTANIASPSAAMTTTSGYVAGAPLPAGSSKATVARIKGSAGYIWKADTTGSNGDKTDNSDLDKVIHINPSDCASVEIDSSGTNSPDGKSGLITVNTSATSGTAILLRGYEYDTPNPPETVEELETNPNSSLKWYILMAGPFNLNVSNCNAIVIPFTLDTSISNLYFIADAEANSLPIALVCPTNMTATCGQTVIYPPAFYSACGDVTVNYSTPDNQTFPRGVTPVTITITDQAGDSTNCTFTVTVVDTTPPVVPTLSDIMGQCSAQAPAPATVNICGNTTNVIIGTTSDPTSFNTQGTNVVHWKFDDGNGNIRLASQNVIVRDTMPPATPTLPDLNYSMCSGTSPTPPTPQTTDNCAGTVFGTTTTQFPITNLGTTVITWNFSDGNGNSTSATQKVNVAGLTFEGFYPPLGGTGGTCAKPLRTLNQGSVNPIKFDMLCGSTLITSGTPPMVKIQSYSKSCVAGAELVDTAATYNNDWHYNWDTSAWAKGTYKVTVLLPDGTSQFVFVTLK